MAEAFQQKGMADENRRLSGQVESANADLAALNARLEHLLEQQRQHADLLQAQASQSRDLIDELPAAVLGVDPDGLVAMANRRAEALWSEADGLLGREAAELVPGWSPEAVDVGSTISGALGGTDAAAALVTISGRSYRMVARPMSGSAGVRGSLLLFWPADDRKDGHS